MFTNKKKVNVYTKARLEKIERMKAAGLMPYPTMGEKGMTLHTLKEFRGNYPDIQRLKSDIENGVEQFSNWEIAGRVVLQRKFGNKMGFLTLQSNNERQQVILVRAEMGDIFNVYKSMLDIGDHVYIKGAPYVTDSGELTIKANHIEIIAKALNPLPEKFNGLEDKETRYRKRYLDMIVNPEITNTLKARAVTINTLRELLQKEEYLEVETPVLMEIPGGANARPFETYHNALGAERYLRIAPELYLKRLVVGGMDRVFEISKNFRNEGVDATHNPEFTSLEYYAAYSNYEVLMNEIERMIKEVIKRTNTNMPGEAVHMGKIPFGEDQEIDFNFYGTWKRISYEDALIVIGDVPSAYLNDIPAMIEYLKENDVKVDPTLNKGKLWEKLFDTFVEDKLIDPTYITDYPIEISPLARRSDSNPEIAERFELFIGGKEIANGFNELNDPQEQYERFMAQVADKDSDDEAMHMDSDYIEALMYALPPTAGAGIGIDRLVMLATNQSSIRDVIAFPAMK